MASTGHVKGEMQIRPYKSRSLFRATTAFASESVEHLTSETQNKNQGWSAAAMVLLQESFPESVDVGGKWDLYLRSPA